MDPFTARMLERARDRQRRVDERTGSAAAPAPARSPLRAGAATNSELDGARQTVKAASPRRPAAEQREDKENHPNALHASTRSRLKQLGSLYSTDGDTDLDAYDVEVTPRHSRAEPEPSPPRPALTSSSSSSSSGSSAGLRGRLAGLACQYQQLESEEAQGFTPSGSRSRLVYDFADPSRSPSPPRVVSAVTKPSPERPAAPYRSASPVRYSPPPRPQPSSPTSRPASEYNPPARDWSPERQGSPTRQLSPMRQLSPVRGRLVQERAAVFDRAASPPPPNVDPTEMTLSDRRKLFEKGQPPKVIARFGTPVTPHMLRQRAAAEPPPPPAAPAAFRRAAAEQSRSRPALEEMRSRSPVRQTGPSSSPQPPPEGPPSPSRAVGESTFQAHRKLWESMNNDWRQNDIAQSSRQQRDKELGYLANRWQHKPAELEQAATAAKHLEEMAPPAPPAAAIPPPPPPPSPPPPAPASPPARRPGAASSPVRRPGAANSPVRRPGTASSPVRHSEPAPEFQQSAGNSVTSPASTVYRPGDESTVSYASGHSDAESLGAEILAMARANQPPPSLPTIDESSADSSSDMSGMAACAAIDDVLDDMDQEEDDPTPPKRTRTTPLRRCTSQPETAVSPSVAQLIRRFQLPPPRPAPRHRRSAPCLGTRPPAARTSGARPPTMRTSTPRRSASVTSVTSADVTAVTAAARGGSDSALMAGGAGESPERSVSLPDAELTSASADMTFVPPDLTSATADLTAVPPDLAFVRLDLTSAPADLTAVPPDLGAVSWSGRSPRCWEEAVAAEEAGGEPASAPHSRLRQYLFGAGAAGAAAETPDGAANSATGAGCGSGEGAAGFGRGAVESEWDNGEGAAEAEWGTGEGASEAEWGTGEDGKWTEWGSGEDGKWTEWGALKTERVDGEGAGSVSDLVSQLEAVCLRRGGGDGEPETHPHILPSSGVRHKRQESGVFRTPMATCVLSPEQDPNLPSVVLDGDGAEMPLMHSVSFYRRQRPQEVRVTPVRPVVRNREVARYPEEPSSSGQQQQLAAGTQERIKQLQKEATQQMNVMSQASQALNLCNSTIEFTGSAEMVEAERLLLVATHRRQAALSEIQRLKTEGAMRQQGIVRSASRGSLSVSSVTLPVKSSFVREVAAGSANYVYYFVVLLRYRGQVITTQMLSSEDSIKGNAINFPNLVSFRELESDFGVALEVYGLQAPRELLPHDAKYHIRKDRAKTPKKLLKQQSALTSPAVQSPAGPGAVRATSFQLMGFLHLTARNLANNSWALEKVPSQSPLDGGVLMTVTCHADCAVEERGFVTVFDDVSGFGAWHRRWAALSGGRLSFWKYPEDEQRAPPVAEVDLRRCVTERVGPVPRDICARQNTLLLVTVRQARPNDADSLVMQRRGAMTRLRHLLSLDIRDERQLWTDKLNETLANIRAWDPDAMQPHLDPSA